MKKVWVIVLTACLCLGGAVGLRRAKRLKFRSRFHRAIRYERRLPSASGSFQTD